MILEMRERIQEWNQVKFVADNLYYFKNFKGCHPGILLGPFLNIST